MMQYQTVIVVNYNQIVIHIGSPLLMTTAIVTVKYQLVQTEFGKNFEVECGKILIYPDIG